MSLGFARQNGITLIKDISPLPIETIDGKPLGSGRVSAITQELVLNTGLLHSETIQFCLLLMPLLFLGYRGFAGMTPTFPGGRVRLYGGVNPVIMIALHLLFQ